MHIAVCDDNVADRKQMERLLGRESERRKNDTGVFYVDSYGDSTALLQNPMLYDLFFLDLASEACDSLAIARKLRKESVTAPIVLCSSTGNAPEEIASLSHEASDFIYLSKPILTEKLKEVLDHAIVMQQNRIPTIELRSDKDTLYVLEDDIVYAVSSGMFVHIFLKDGTCLPIISTLENFYSGVSMYPHMLLLTEKSMINIAYLKKYHLFSVTLKDGTKVKSSPFSLKYIKIALQEYLAEQS